MTTEIPPNIRVLSNGAWYDLEKKHIVAGAKWTSAEASALAKRKHEVAREKAAEGLRRRVEEQGLPANTPEDAWGSVVNMQTLLALSPEEGHASTQAAKLVGHAAGMLQAAQAPQVDRRSVTINVTADVAERLRLLSGVTAAGVGVAHAGERMGDALDDSSWQASEAGADAECIDVEMAGSVGA